jgi:hypothetical protein
LFEIGPNNFDDRRSIMSNRIGGIEILAGLCLAMMVAAGCTSSRVNLVDTERVTVERMATRGHVEIGKVYVYQEEGDLVVTGRVKRKSMNLRSARGHMDVAVISPSGRVIETESVAQMPEVIGMTRRTRREGSHFEARFLLVPPEGSTVRIAFHPEKYAPGKYIDCEKNAAANI